MAQLAFLCPAAWRACGRQCEPHPALEWRRSYSLGTDVLLGPGAGLAQLLMTVPWPQLLQFGATGLAHLALETPFPVALTVRSPAGCGWRNWAKLLGGVAVDLRRRRHREPHPALDGCIKGTTGLAWWQMVCTGPGWCSWQGGCLGQGATQATGVTLLPDFCQCQVYVQKCFVVLCFV